MGRNGAGKSTLLKMVAGQLAPDQGSIALGASLKMGYFAQQALDLLDPSLTVWEQIQKDFPLESVGVLRNLLGAFQFPGDDVQKSIKALSGGEKTRLAMARLLLDPPNFLVLDEPTNHLDIPARETLEDGLSGYDGTLLFVSHDRFFIDRVATRVWAIEDGRLAQYLGNYSDMLNERARRNGQLPAAPPKQPEPAVVEQPEPDGQRAKPRPRQYDKLVRESQRRLAAAERTVSKLEDRLMEIEERLSRASIDQKLDLVAKLGLAHEETQRELDLAYAEWSAAGAELEELTAQAALAAEGA
jgi:ATP-binding cassette subfamily F protein 3